MTPFLQLALVVAIIILTAKLAGYVSTRLGQPSVFGELLVGLFLGPTFLDLTHLYVITDPHLGEVIHEMAELGVLFLMFLAGLELEFDELAKNTRVAGFAGVLGVLVPVGAGWLVGDLAGLTTNQAIFLGLTLGATSVSISAQTLMELKVLRSKVGLGLLGAAVFDDILVILLLSTFTALVGGEGGFGEIMFTILRMLLFLGLSVIFGLYILPRISRLTSKLPISQGVIALAVVIMLLYGLSAELLGEMAAITGTFVAGLMFGRTTEKRTIEHGFTVLAYSFFVPIFFVDIGLQVDASQLGNSIGLVVIICLVAVLSKILGAGLGAKLGGFDLRQSTQMGIGMVSRGEVGLIVASVGLNQELVTPSIFSGVVIMVLFTTLITPPMLRATFSTSKPMVEQSEAA